MLRTWKKKYIMFSLFLCSFSLFCSFRCRADFAYRVHFHAFTFCLIFGQAFCVPRAVSPPSRMMRVSFFYLIVGFARTVSAAVPKKLSVLQPQFSSRRLGFGRQKMSHWVQGAECQMTHSRAKINSDAGKKISASLAKIMKDWVTFAKRNSVLYSLASGASSACACECIRDCAAQSRPPNQNSTGSMLGYYRDGDRMPYDDDLDVAVCPKKWSILTGVILQRLRIQVSTHTHTSVHTHTHTSVHTHTHTNIHTHTHSDQTHTLDRARLLLTPVSVFIIICFGGGGFPLTQT